MIAFGPVPSRRLGRSLGVNNIPPKVCSYACVYCQLGRAQTMTADRSAFYGTDALLHAVREKAAGAAKTGEPIDFITFVPDGEPTLDRDLGETIRQLSSLGIPVAVITNASLLWQPDVRQAVAAADWVSVKIDAVDETLWRRLDRPHKSLELTRILDGILAFTRDFHGTLVTETMLVRNANDRREPMQALARFLERVGPATAYLSVPTRPPTEAWVAPPDEGCLNRAYQIVDARVAHVELLTGYEGNAFALTGDVREDLLSITAVHPMRRDAVDDLLRKAGVSWSVVDALVAGDQLVVSTYEGHTYYARRLQRLPNGHLAISGCNDGPSTGQFIHGRSP